MKWHAHTFKVLWLLKAGKPSEMEDNADKGGTPCHTPAICSPNYLCGTPTVWLGLYVLWRTSCQVISRHKIAVSMRVPCTACLLVSVISLWIYVLAEMPIISPVYTCTSFLTRAEKWLEKKVEKIRECTATSRQHYHVAFMAPHCTFIYFLLYWQMLVISRDGNSVVKAV